MGHSPAPIIPPGISPPAHRDEETRIPRPTGSSPTINPVAASVPIRSANSGFELRFCPAIVEMPDQRTDRDEQGQRHRQIDAHADAERGAGASCPSCRASQSIAITMAPIKRAQPDQRPVYPPSRGIPCASCRDSAMPCGACSAFRDPRRAMPTNPKVFLEQVEHDRNDQRAEDHAEHQTPPAASTVSPRPAARSSGPEDCRWRSSPPKKTMPVVNRA